MNMQYYLKLTIIPHRQKTVGSLIKSIPLKDSTHSSSKLLFHSISIESLFKSQLEEWTKLSLCLTPHRTNDLYKWQQISVEWRMKGKRKTLRYFVLLFCDLLKIITGPICHTRASSLFPVASDTLSEKKCKWRWIGSSIISALSPGLSNFASDEIYIQYQVS